MTSRDNAGYGSYVSIALERATERRRVFAPAAVIAIRSLLVADAVASRVPR